MSDNVDVCSKKREIVMSCKYVEFVNFYMKSDKFCLGIKVSTNEWIITNKRWNIRML